MGYVSLAPQGIPRTEGSLHTITRVQEKQELVKQKMDRKGIPNKKKNTCKGQGQG